MEAKRNLSLAFGCGDDQHLDILAHCVRTDCTHICTNVLSVKVRLIDNTFELIIKCARG